MRQCAGIANRCLGKYTHTHTHTHTPLAVPTVSISVSGSDWKRPCKYTSDSFAQRRRITHNQISILDILSRFTLFQISMQIDVSMYQQPTRFSTMCFICPFKLPLNVSGDSFAHLQERFDCIYSCLEHCTDCAVCCRPVTPVGSRQHHRYIVPNSCIYSQSAPEDVRNCRQNHLEKA